jgi:hypothetical protein
VDLTTAHILFPVGVIQEQPTIRRTVAARNRAAVIAQPFEVMMKRMVPFYRTLFWIISCSACVWCFGQANEPFIPASRPFAMSRARAPDTQILLSGTRLNKDRAWLFC